VLLQKESNPRLNTIISYGDGYIEINAVLYRHAICFTPEGDVTPWPVTGVHDITAARVRELARLTERSQDPLAFLEDRPPERSPDTPEVVLIGTGGRQHFLPADYARPLLTQGVGLEVMSTAAAARTYNILMSEGRRVVAALLMHEDFPT